MHSTNVMTPRQVKRGWDFKKRSEKNKRVLKIQQVNDHWIRTRLTKCS